MKDFVFATGLKTSIGLPRKQVEQTPPKVSDPHLGSDSVDGLDADTSMHSSCKPDVIEWLMRRRSHTSAG